MAETIRSVSELLDVLFASNQAPRSITEQDVRDAIVSISLETADFSDLPRSSEDLQVGRCWIDITTALRVVTVYLPGLATAATLGGSGSLFADGQIAGRFTFPASSIIGGSAAFTANATPISTGDFSLEFSNAFDRGTVVIGGAQLASARLLGGGVAALTAATVIRKAASVLAGGAGTIAIPSPLAGGSFSTAFSTAFQLGGSLTMQQTASATLSPTSGIIATPQRGTTTAWDPAATSIYITLSGTNLIATKTANAGWYGGVKSTNFRSGGKWYWELSIGAKAGDTGVGLANPSWPPDNGDPTFGSFLGLNGATTSIGLYGDVSNGYVNDGSGTIISPMPNVGANANVGIALDCDNWKWWARQDGGAWNVGQAGAQDPASNQGGIPIGTSYRTGGIGPAITMQALNDVVIGRFAPASWSFVPPSGFSAI